MSLKNMTQSKAKDLVERQDRLEVTIEALMRKMDKLSIEIISVHDVPSHNEKEVKRSTRQALSPPHKSIVENSDDDDDVVNHKRKSHTHQNSINKTRPRREFGGRFCPNKEFNQRMIFYDHGGLDCDLGSIKLKIIAF
jgi:seryl-tRNA synthetase